MSAPQLFLIVNETHGKPTSISPDPAPIDGGGGPPHSPEMNERIARLEGSADGYKQSQTILISAVSAISALLFAGLTLIVGLLIWNDQKATTRMDGLEAKIDAIPERLAQEFRAMRAETAAQTSAIANSITAAKQTPPQVILVPAAELAKPAP